LKEIDRLEEGIGFIVGAIEVTKQYGRLAEPMRAVYFELSTILRRLERLYSDRRIRWKVRGQLPMLGNPRLIEQTVVELLDNALRFIHRQKGKVQVSAYRHKSTAIIRIDDNGPGIAPDRKKHIFKPAVTDDPAAHFGFGLSFVDSVVQRHGGNVGEYGTPGKGASFRIVFPLLNGESKHGQELGKNR
jgi:two-component system sensor histidine kinase RstB